MKYIPYNRRKIWHRIIKFFFIIIFFFFCISEIILPISQGEDYNPPQEESIDFTAFSLEELKQVMIISVLKKPQKLSEATSAITIITQEDIQKSGATNIPELLRNIPGFQVARINSSTWAVSARGFNHRYANKLLVLMDGRSLYTPLFSGVYWDIQDTMLEDIDRIEVIRGPGAALWGANAVNGVINIVTKRVKDTQGGLLVSGLGNEERRFSSFRYGGKIASNSYSRFYIKYFERDNLIFSNGVDGGDDWNSFRGGGRIDWSLSGENTLTLQGDIYDGKNSEKMFSWNPSYPEGKYINLDNNFSGGNLLCRWMNPLSMTSAINVQLYYDLTQREKKMFDNSQYKEKFHIFDMDLQHNFLLGIRQEMIWGIGYRFISDKFEAYPSDRPIFILDPDSRNTQIFSSFFQNDITIIRNKLKLSIGSKLEHNDYTGWEIQPSIRLLFKPTEIQNLWASVSRAVRTPSRSEYDPMSFEIDNDDDNRPHFNISNPDIHKVEAEDLLANEIGYRIQPTDYFSLDIATFYNIYTNLLQYPKDIRTKARNYGFEICAEWDILSWYSLSLSYTYLHMNVISSNINYDFFIDSNSDFYLDSNSDFHWDKDNPPPPPPQPSFDDLVEKASPAHQFAFNSSIYIGENINLDLDLRYVDNLGNFVDSYVEMDACLGWSPRQDLTISIVGENLLHKNHLEFLSQGPLPYSSGQDIEAQRSVYGKITCQF